MTFRPRRSAAIPAPRTLVAAAKPAAHEPGELLAQGASLAAEALTARGEDLSAARLLSGDADELTAAGAAWAALGALERGAPHEARATLQAMLAAQAPTGQLPAKLQRRRGLFDGLLGLFGSPAPRRALDAPVFAACPADGAGQTAILVWACGEYAVRAGDSSFVQAHAVALEAALDWVDARPEARGVGTEAAYHLAQMAVGHVAIGRGDAVSGARRWAAAAAAKGRIQDAERDARTEACDELLAVYIGACDQPTALAALDQARGQAPAGLVALAACAAGDPARGQAVLAIEAQQALAAGGFASPAEAGVWLRARHEVERALVAAQAQAAKARPSRRQLTLSEDEARILSVC